MQWWCKHSFGNITCALVEKFFFFWWKEHKKRAMEEEILIKCSNWRNRLMVCSVKKKKCDTNGAKIINCQSNLQWWSKHSFGNITCALVEKCFFFFFFGKEHKKRAMEEAVLIKCSNWRNRLMVCSFKKKKCDTNGLNHTG